jgi:DNA polymerase III sliding clamp (beta) subunit (PCNA family)
VSLIDGKYPNYEAVIPKENPNKLMIDRSQFLSSVRRVAISLIKQHTNSFENCWVLN